MSSSGLKHNKVYCIFRETNISDVGRKKYECGNNESPRYKFRCSAKYGSRKCRLAKDSFGENKKDVPLKPLTIEYSIEPKRGRDLLWPDEGESFE